MTLEDILTLSRAGYTAQQITALNQQSFQRIPQMAQPQMVQPQMVQPQMVQPQMAQPQMVQPQMVQPQMVQPQTVQPQMAQPQMVQPQMVQPQFGSNGQYTEVMVSILPYFHRILLFRHRQTL